MAIYRRSDGWTVETVQLNDDTEDELWYWHLYNSEGVRKNGGLNDSEEQALFAAGYSRRFMNVASLRDSETF